jgi:ATP-dependent Zn protease
VPAIDDREEYRSQTKRDLEELICQLLGGREAERLYYGDGQEDSIGNSQQAALYDLRVPKQRSSRIFRRSREVSPDLQGA